MAVSSDILRTWRHPRRVVADLLDQGQREDRAIAFLMAGCGLIFVAQWPRLARVAHETGDELSKLVAYELVAWIFFWPLMFYAVAGLSWLVLRIAKRRISAYSARLALFWAFLAATPVGLLYGLQTGLNGPGPAVHVVGAIWIAAFFWFWAQGLRAAVAHRG